MYTIANVYLCKSLFIRCHLSPSTSSQHGAVNSTPLAFWGNMLIHLSAVMITPLSIVFVVFFCSFPSSHFNYVTTV